MFDLSFLWVEIFFGHPAFQGWGFALIGRPVDPYFFLCICIFCKFIMNTINRQIYFLGLIIRLLYCINKLFSIFAFEPIVIVVFDFNDQIVITFFIERLNYRLNLVNVDFAFERVSLFLCLYVDQSFACHKHGSLLPLIKSRLLTDGARQSDHLI